MHLERGRLMAFLLGLFLFSVGAIFLKHRDDWFDWIEAFRDRHPSTRMLNPLSALNSPALSRWNMIWGGALALLAGLFLLVVSIAGGFAR